jgi:hypothetical protein
MTMWEMLFIISVALIIIGSFGGSNTVRAGERDQTRSFYDRSGSFAGSSNSRDNTSSFYDRSGKFSGSSIRNSDGTTSYYDQSGKFRGSSTNTTQPR